VADRIHIRPARIESVDIKRDGSNVVMVTGSGKVAFNTHWKHAERIARAILEQCRRIEQHEEMPRTIADQALLTRLGAGFGLLPQGVSPAVEAEVAREAQHNSDLRKYLPGRVKSQELVYAPSVRRHPVEGDE